MKFLDELAARRRFGMRPGLETITALCAALDDPQRRFKAIHVAGTNGKGAVCAILEAALRMRPGIRVGRYTSPHLVKINERFFLDGRPVDDATLERVSGRVSALISDSRSAVPEPTFFEALTIVAFALYAEAKVDYAILECGLGGRLDATNICDPSVCVITRIGLDHCDWLGDTVEKIAAEKAGILKTGVPVVLGRNEPSVIEIVRRRALEIGAPFHYAPDLAGDGEIPDGFSLRGSFNRENAVTALAALRVLFPGSRLPRIVCWPGRFQQIGGFVIDGAHNPPAARALAAALREGGAGPKTLDLVAGFCGDKDVEEVLAVLAPLVRKGFAVKTNNPRSLPAEDTAARMHAAGIDAEACDSLREAIDRTGLGIPDAGRDAAKALICGSLFLAGEALVELGVYPWKAQRFDPSELLKQGG